METSSFLLPNVLIFYAVDLTCCLLSCYSGRNISTSILGQPLHLWCKFHHLSPSQGFQFCPTNFCHIPECLISTWSSHGKFNWKNRFLLCPYMSFQLSPFLPTTWLLPFKQNFSKDVSVVIFLNPSALILSSIHCNIATIFAISMTLLLSRSSITSLLQIQWLVS